MHDQTYNSTCQHDRESSSSAPKRLRSSTGIVHDKNLCVWCMKPQDERPPERTGRWLLISYTSSWRLGVCIGYALVLASFPGRPLALSTLYPKKVKDAKALSSTLKEIATGMQTHDRYITYKQGELPVSNRAQRAVGNIEPQRK